MDRGAWWATAHGVAKSRMQLSGLVCTHPWYDAGGPLSPSPWPLSCRTCDAAGTPAELAVSGASGLWHNLSFPLRITLFAELSLVSSLSFKPRPLSWTSALLSVSAPTFPLLVLTLRCNELTPLCRDQGRPCWPSSLQGGRCQASQKHPPATGEADDQGGQGQGAQGAFLP